MLLLLLVSKKKAPKSRKMSTWILGVTNVTIKRVHDVYLDTPMHGVCVDNRSGTHGDHTIGKMCLDNLINSVRFPPKVIGWPTKTVQNGVMRYKKDIPAEGVAIQTNSTANNNKMFSSPNSCSGPRRVLTSFFKEMWSKVAYLDSLVANGGGEEADIGRIVDPKCRYFLWSFAVLRRP